jgi:hypothetical protein
MRGVGSRRERKVQTAGLRGQLSRLTSSHWEGALQQLLMGKDHDERTLIVGGIGGLAAALALTRLSTTSPWSSGHSGLPGRRGDQAAGDLGVDLSPAPAGACCRAPGCGVRSHSPTCRPVCPRRRRQIIESTRCPQSFRAPTDRPVGWSAGPAGATVTACGWHSRLSWPVRSRCGSRPGRHEAVHGTPAGGTVERPAAVPDWDWPLDGVAVVVQPFDLSSVAAGPPWR